MNQSTETCKLNRPKIKPLSQLVLISLLEFALFSYLFYISSKCFNIVYNMSRSFNQVNYYFINFIGLHASIYVSYLKLRTMYDPNYVSPCKACVSDGEIKNTTIDDMLYDVHKVLQHKKASLFFNIPNSFYGIFYYIFLMYLSYYNDSIYFNLLHKFMCICSFILSLYLWKTMCVDIKRICVICMSIHAVNFINLVGSLTFS